MGTRVQMVLIDALNLTLQYYAESLSPGGHQLTITANNGFFDLDYINVLNVVPGNGNADNPLGTPGFLPSSNDSGGAQIPGNGNTTLHANQNNGQQDASTYAYFHLSVWMCRLLT